MFLTQDYRHAPPQWASFPNLIVMVNVLEVNSVFLEDKWLEIKWLSEGIC